MESEIQIETTNILDLPDKILIQIFKSAENDKKLSETCVRFYDLVNMMKQKNYSLTVEDCFINPKFELDQWLEGSQISLYINQERAGLEDKLHYFLQLYGHQVINLTLGVNIKSFASQLIQLIPNLQELYLQASFSLENVQLEKHSIKLKKLRCFDYVLAECVELFTYEELQIRGWLGPEYPNIALMLRNDTNLKKLSFIDKNLICNITEAMNELDLEVLEFLGRTEVDQEMLSNCLINQKNLKEFVFEPKMELELWTIICDNLTMLEKLTLKINEEIIGQNFSRISHLEALKELNITFGWNYEWFFELLI